MNNKNIACCQEKDLYTGLYKFCYGSHSYSNHNYYYKGFQCDFFSVSSYGYSYDFEIKTNLKDLKKDFLKPKMKKMYEGEISNYHFYVLPESVISESKPLINKLSGIIEYDTGFNLKKIKSARILHMRKFDDQLHLLNAINKRYKLLVNGKA